MTFTTLSGPPASRRRGDRHLWFFLLLYALGAWRIYGNLGLLDNSRLITSFLSDSVQQSWFLGYWRWAVVHAHLAAWTNLMDFPAGFNLLDNPSLPLLAIPAAPLTALFGPVATLDLLFRLAFVVSALSAFLVIRRLVTSQLAAGIGGLLYGFGPAAVAGSQNWLHFVFIPFPPVMLYLAYRGVTRPNRARRYGLALGAATVAQVLVDPEIAVEALVLSALTVAAFALARAARGTLRRKDFSGPIRMVTGFALVGLLPLGLLAYLILYGRGSYHGGLVPLHTGGYSPLETLLPKPGNYVSSLFGIEPPAYLDSFENSGYVGIPLVVAFAAIALRLRARPVIQAATAMTLIAWVLTLGSYLTDLNGHLSSIPLPFSLIARLPIGDSLNATRFTIFIDLGVAVVLATGIDALSSSWRSRGARISLVSLIVLGALFAIPASAVSSYDLAPLAISDAASPAIQHLIPAGGTVLTLPYTNGGSGTSHASMLWQAEAGMRFKLLGGYAIRQSAPGYPAAGYPNLAQSTVDCLLLAGPKASRGATCQSIPAAEVRLRAFVRHWRVSAVLVETEPGDGEMLKLLDGLYSSRGHDGPMYVWATGIKPLPTLARA